MTLVFNYALAANTLNNSPSPYSWALDTHSNFNDNTIAPTFVTVSAGGLTVNSGSNPRFHVTAKAKFVFEKQNTGDANDDVLAMLSNSFSAPTIAYAYGSGYASAGAVPFIAEVCADFILTNTNNTITIAPMLASGPAALAYTLLSFTGTAQPYTTLQFICSFN